MVCGEWHIKWFFFIIFNDIVILESLEDKIFKYMYDKVYYILFRIVDPIGHKKFCENSLFYIEIKIFTFIITK